MAGRDVDLAARVELTRQIFGTLGSDHGCPLNLSDLERAAVLLEQFLFRDAASRDEYLSLPTLRSRIKSIIRRTAAEAAQWSAAFSLPVHPPDASRSSAPGSRTDVSAGRGGYVDGCSTGHDVLSAMNVQAGSYGRVKYHPSNSALSQGRGLVGKNQCHNRQPGNGFRQCGPQNSNQFISVYPPNSAALDGRFTGSLAGQGPSVDVYPNGHDQLSAPFARKRPRQSSAIDTGQFLSPEGIPGNSRYYDNSLNCVSFGDLGSPRGYHDISYGASSSKGHAIAPKNLQRSNLRAPSSVVQCPLQSPHHGLPSNQSPLNTVAPKVSSTCSGSRVPTNSYSSHPGGVPKVNLAHDDTEGMLPQKRFKTDGLLGSFSSKHEIPRVDKLPKLQQYPELPVSIDSQFPEPVAMYTEQNAAINGVLKNPMKDVYEGGGGNDVPPLEEIYLASSYRGTMDNNQFEAVADSCDWGSGGMITSSEEPALGCGDGEQVMEDVPILSLDAAFCPPLEVTVAPDTDNIDMMKQDLATDEALVDHSKLRSDPDLNPCRAEERQIIEPTNNVSEPEWTLSEAILEELNEVTVSLGRKTTGASLLEYFTREEIVDHLSDLGKWSSQIMPDDTEMDAALKPSERLCQLCRQKDLLFAPATMDCSSCYRIIKPDTDYFTVDQGEKLYFCSKKCGKNVKGKVDLVKRRHTERMVEPWVQCDSCRGWQHQICGLYNKERDPTEKAEYSCALCCLKVKNSDARTTFGHGCIFTAKDLPPTKLSDHIEKWLYNRLKQEREDRARASGKNFDKVPEAEGLVVRVVSSVTKKVEVNKQFQDMFCHENYPSELPYKSKVIALFQKIGGVDVFLFGMYVQEYGTDCSQPNERRVYISYLDSVKYFHPDIRSAYEVNLRSFVYHEVLIGYLDYCKQRGFVSCYLWACPPVKGDDYLFYCHPEFQRNLPRKLLVKWYRQVFCRATDEKVVLSCTNFYEYHCAPSRQAKFKVTAARLPYFEGDHWSRGLEKFLKDITQKPVSKRALKGCKNWKDVLLMDKIEQTMPDKEEFMVAHLQNVCTTCHDVISSGKRWFCNLCKDFQLCERCVDSGEACRTSKGPPVCREQHLLSQATVDSIPEDTEDGDSTIENQLFENRQYFLDFCQKNNYQFDTLRRAKHSSMMILHHLHESMNKKSVGTASCSLCHGELVDPSMACPTCRESTNPASAAEEPVPEANPMKSGSMDMKDLTNLMSHCSQCKPPKGQGCSFPHCSKVKWLFRHAAQCSLPASPQGCECRYFRVLLKLHVRSCQALDCPVPLCGEMKSRLTMELREPRAKGSGGS